MTAKKNRVVLQYNSFTQTFKQTDLSHFDISKLITQSQSGISEVYQLTTDN